MKLNLAIPALASVVVLLAGTPARASNVFSDAQPGSLGGETATLLDSVGFIRGAQVFTQAINVTSAGTLTIKLAEIPWLDTLQSLNCFLSAPGGGIVGAAQNGGFESVDVQPGTVYVNWYGQAKGPLSLGAYGISVQFQSALPVPLPPALILMLSGLAFLALGVRRSRPWPATAC
jgi:hypothetical protein